MHVAVVALETTIGSDQELGQVPRIVRLCHYPQLVSSSSGAVVSPSPNAHSCAYMHVEHYVWDCPLLTKNHHPRCCNTPRQPGSCCSRCCRPCAYRRNLLPCHDQPSRGPQVSPLLLISQSCFVQCLPAPTPSPMGLAKWDRLGLTLGANLGMHTCKTCCVDR